MTRDKTDLYNCDLEIIWAIEDLGNCELPEHGDDTKNEALRMWENPTAYESYLVLHLAFKACHYDSLYWGMNNYRWSYERHPDDIEYAVLEAMGLPHNCLTLDGDQVLDNRKDYKTTDAEREEFKRNMLRELRP
jgi:hypothetical protein